ncbi:MAG: C40 family peptidase [Lachnospirales bacterium]
MFKVILYKDNQAEDITKQVSELSWSENLDTVGATLSFSVSDVVDRYITRLAIVAGDIISLYNDNEELIRGIVVNVTRDYPKRNVKVCDFGFYLNKNDIVIQFKNKSVSQCLKELFSKVGISVGSICDMPAKVNGVYIKNVNEVIKELIKIQQDNDGKKYYYELRGKNIYVFQLPTEPIDYIFKPATNVAAFDVTDKNAHGRGKYSHSIENMKNRVTAIIDSKTTGNMPAMEYTISDNTNIAKYGLLAENYNVNSDDYKNIKNIAKTELEDKNKLSRELEMDFIGHYKARAGRVMHIVDDYLGINDYFRIQSVNHKIDGGIHTMSCTLDYVKEAPANKYTEIKVIQREDIKTEGSSADFDSLYSILNAQVGKSYVWGATGPNSFDCSGLVYYCFNKAGKKISRMTAQGYYNSCTKVKAKDRQKGDLIFWAKNGKVYHIAVYVGDGYQISAENEKVGVVKKKVTSGVYAYGRL